MNHVSLENQSKIIGIRNFSGINKMVDYYIVTREGKRIYAFSRRYTNGTYELCKSGIRVNALTTYKSHDTAIMDLVKYTKRMLPYLIEEYELRTIA